MRVQNFDVYDSSSIRLAEVAENRNFQYVESHLPDRGEMRPKLQEPAATDRYFSFFYFSFRSYFCGRFRTKMAISLKRTLNAERRGGAARKKRPRVEPNFGGFEEPFFFFSLVFSLAENV